MPRLSFRSSVEPCRCHSPCCHGPDGFSAIDQVKHLPRYSRPDCRPSAERQWAGRRSPSACGLSSSARPASGQSLGSAPPFSATGAPVSLYRRGIDQNLGRWPSGLRQRVEKLRPDAFLRPADVTIVDRLVRAVDLGRIRPAAAGLQDMDDPADHATIIYTGHPAGIGRKVRFDLFKLGGGQPEIRAIQIRSPFEDLESYSRSIT